MILDIRHKGLRKLYEDDSSKGVEQIYVEKLRRILFKLEDAECAEDMNLPGYRLHFLTGILKGFWSVTVGANWRVIFRFDGHDATDIDLVDYH